MICTTGIVIQKCIEFCWLFFKYILLIMLLQLSHFFSPLFPSTLQPPLPLHPPTLSSCPWVVHISSLACVFPILFLTSPVYFVPTIYASYSQAFLWASRLPVFWTRHLIGWLSLHCLVLFLEFWSLSFGPYFFVFMHPLHCKGQSLRYSPGQGNPCLCFVVLYVGEGSEREQCGLLGSLPASFH